MEENTKQLVSKIINTYNAVNHVQTSLDKPKIDYIDPAPISEASNRIQAELEQAREDAINYFGYILN